jgi:DNA-binding HxlR family transcriptional regulator
MLDIAPPGLSRTSTRMPDIGPSRPPERSVGVRTPAAPEPGLPDLECPVAAAARVLGARWTIQILYQLAEPMRFCELQNAVGGVNPRTLTQTLRFLQAEGLVEVGRSGGAVRHGLSLGGAQLVPVLGSLRDWQMTWLADRRLRASEAPVAEHDETR